MFRKLKQFNVAREKRKKLLRDLEEIKNEDLFEEGVVEIKSAERIRKIESIPGLGYSLDGRTVTLHNLKKIQVTQIKRYKKKLPVRVGVA